MGEREKMKNRETVQSPRSKVQCPSVSAKASVFASFDETSRRDKMSKAVQRCVSGLGFRVSSQRKLAGGITAMAGQDAECGFVGSGLDPALAGPHRFMEGVGV